MDWQIPLPASCGWDNPLEKAKGKWTDRLGIRSARPEPAETPEEYLVARFRRTLDYILGNSL